MRNIVLTAVVIAVVVAGGLAGTLAGFVDTEESTGNFVQAGISDLLINNANDPNVGAKIQFSHAVPCKSTDFWIDAFNWGSCQGGNLYMHFKDVISVESGTKLHGNISYVYDGVSNVGGGIPFGYRAAVGLEPQGPGVWSSEPEKIAEVGNGWVGNFYITGNNSNLKGEDFASGVSAILDVKVEVPLIGTLGNTLGNPDTNGDGAVSPTEYAAWVTNGNRWATPASLADTLANIACHNDLLGFLVTQTQTFIHVDVHIQQLQALPMVDYDGDGVVGDADDVLLSYWPSNAIQGDYAMWTMMFTLATDPP